MIVKLDISRLNIFPSQDDCKTNNFLRSFIGLQESFIFLSGPLS